MYFRPPTQLLGFLSQPPLMQCFRFPLRAWIIQSSSLIPLQECRIHPCVLFTHPINGPPCHSMNPQKQKHQCQTSAAALTPIIWKFDMPVQFLLNVAWFSRLFSDADEMFEIEFLWEQVYPNQKICRFIQLFSFCICPILSADYFRKELARIKDRQSDSSTQIWWIFISSL